MRGGIEKRPEVVTYALEAMRRVGLEAVQGKIRGGTDGSHFTAMGMPCPNIFCGSANYHSRHEYASVQHMALSAQTIVEIAKVWAEKS